MQQRILRCCLSFRIVEGNLVWRRVYLDRAETDPQRLLLSSDIALGYLGDTAAEIARIQHFTGLTQPSAIIR